MLARLVIQTIGLIVYFLNSLDNALASTNRLKIANAITPISIVAVQQCATVELQALINVKKCFVKRVIFLNVSSPPQREKPQITDRR
ncbi:hypothetical protein [Pseudomonas syringae]|uniref:hypothetical protein n=1 Tax=Pseudomonas syringae TaxID=317 RepID=UPI0018653CE0|nr:hypothetical protein [Pseudomonas syringae]QVI78096.1 hypothetical protein KHW13_16040 [Pseudomonas syringae]